MDRTLHKFYINDTLILHVVCYDKKQIEYVRGRSCAGLLDVAEVYIKIDRGKSYGIDLYRRR